MTEQRPYQDRYEAGKILARRIPDRVRELDPIVLALPRGGVPVGLEVARVLHAPLDIFVVRKLGAPQRPELAIGAISSGGYKVLNHPLIRQMHVAGIEIDQIAERELSELHRREVLYRGDRPPIEMRGRAVVLVDDGLATGFTMRAAIVAARDQGAALLVVAVPVGSAEACAELSLLANEVICPLQPEPFHAVGLWYDKFLPTSDDEVKKCLAANHTMRESRGGSERWR